MSSRNIIAFALAILFAVALVSAQDTKKSYTFKGTVTDVDASAKKLVVANENIPGWMAAMTMNYEVDDPAVLKQLQKGDQIEATVYDGDTKLHKVKVVGHQKK